MTVVLKHRLNAPSLVGYAVVEVFVSSYPLIYTWEYRIDSYSFLVDELSSLNLNAGTASYRNHK